MNDLLLEVRGGWHVWAGWIFGAQTDHNPYNILVSLYIWRITGNCKPSQKKAECILGFRRLKQLDGKCCNS